MCYLYSEPVYDICGVKPRVLMYCHVVGWYILHVASDPFLNPVYGYRKGFTRDIKKKTVENKLKLRGSVS